MRDGELLERVWLGPAERSCDAVARVFVVADRDDGRTGELRAATYGRGVWQIPLLTAATAAQLVMSVSPSSLIFASQAVATASAPQSVTITNTGSAPLTIAQIAMSQSQLPLGPQSELIPAGGPSVLWAFVLAPVGVIATRRRGARVRLRFSAF